MWRNRSIPMRKFLLCALGGAPNLRRPPQDVADDLSDLKGRLEIQEKQIQELRQTPRRDSPRGPTCHHRSADHSGRGCPRQGGQEG